MLGPRLLLRAELLKQSGHVDVVRGSAFDVRDRAIFAAVAQVVHRESRFHNGFFKLQIRGRFQLIHLRKNLPGILSLRRNAAVRKLSRSSNFQGANA